MQPIIETKTAAPHSRIPWLRQVIPVLVGLALAMPAAATFAQTTSPSAACAGAQKAGEGEGGYAGTTATALQKAGEGEGGYAGTTATALQKAGEGEGGYAGTTATGSAKTAAIPCKG